MVGASPHELALLPHLTPSTVGPSHWRSTHSSGCRAQGAERRVPINYASRYRSSGDLARASYLPFKVNATGVMPVIFSTSLLAVPGAIARFSGVEALQPAAVALSPGGPLYLPANVLFIIAINYYYTFLQLDPNDVADQLKRQVWSLPLIHLYSRA